MFKPRSLAAAGPAPSVRLRAVGLRVSRAKSHRDRLVLPNLNRFPPRKSNRKRQSAGLRCPSCTQSTPEQRVSLCSPLGASVRTRRVQASGMWSVHGSWASRGWDVRQIQARAQAQSSVVDRQREVGWESRAGGAVDLLEMWAKRACAQRNSGSGENWASRAVDDVERARGQGGQCAVRGRSWTRGVGACGRSWAGRGGMKRWLGADSTRRVMWCVREVGAYSGAGRHREAVTGVMGGDVCEAGVCTLAFSRRPDANLAGDVGWVADAVGGSEVEAGRGRIAGGRRARGVDGAGVVDGRRAVPLRYPTALADTSRLERPARWRTVRATGGYTARVHPAAV
ncbi:hypothetical protein B0H10DRAFT_1950719 [Mycena sp. CBHHK59/15]|nr:hypothetical protein B0H10DRAFT_1950719 [Mycena sp. CBHHK59/15]